MYDELVNRFYSHEGYTEGFLFNPSNSRAFLIGPATVDSFINNVPIDFSYIRKERLPFDSMFFEFSEPIDISCPLLSEKCALRAVFLGKDSEETRYGRHDSYELKLFYKPLSGGIVEMPIKFGHNGRLLNRYRGWVYDDDLSRQTERMVHFEIHMPSESIRYNRVSSDYNDKELDDQAISRVVERCNATKEKVSTLEQEAKINPARQAEHLFAELEAEQAEEERSKILYFEKKSLKELDHHEVFTKIPNLCVNLINYINAHNITVIKREREVIYLDHYERGKKKKRSENQPFHLVVVQDKVYEESEEPKEIGKWKLEERVYVRGHDRRYRDCSGNIRMIIWVSPCIKGPSNAPFANQRYVVLAEKLIREREMMRTYHANDS